MKTATAYIAAALCQIVSSQDIGLYNVALYNELPDFEDTSQNGISRSNEIKSLGQIFIDHDVNDDFGLSLLHKHFDLEANEMIVETIYDNVSYSSPMAVPSSYNLSEDNVFGHRYGYVDGHWVPLEFSAYSSENPNLRRRHEKLTATESADFLNQLGKTLNEMELDGVFGVGIRTRDHFAADGSFETDIGKRTLMVTAHNDLSAQCGSDAFPSSGLASCCYEAPAFWSFQKDATGAVWCRH